MKTKMYVFAVLVMMSFVIVSCGGNSAQHKSQFDFTGEELVVGAFGGSAGNQIKALAGDVFQSLTGADIRFVYGTSRIHLNTLIEAKKAGEKPPFDVVLLDGVVLQPAEDNDLLEKATEEDIPQMENLITQALPQGNYGPAFQFFSVGIAYNYPALRQAEVPEPNSWADFWKPEFKGHVAIPGIYHTAGMDFVIAATKVAGGNPLTIEGMKKGIDLIKKMEPAMIYQKMAPLKEAVDNRKIWIFPIYNSRAYNWISNGAELRFMYPKERGFGHLTTISTVKGTKNKRLADMFVNLVLTQGYQYGQTAETPFGPVNRNVIEPLSAFPKIVERCPLGEAGLEKLYIPPWKSLNKIRKEVEEYWFSQFPKPK